MKKILTLIIIPLIISCSKEKVEVSETVDITVKIFTNVAAGKWQYGIETNKKLPQSLTMFVTWKIYKRQSPFEVDSPVNYLYDEAAQIFHNSDTTYTRGIINTPISNQGGIFADSIHVFIYDDLGYSFNIQTGG